MLSERRVDFDPSRRRLLIDGAKAAAGIYLRGKIMPDLTEMAQVATGSVAKLLNARMGIVNRGAEESSEGVNVRALPDQSQQLDNVNNIPPAQVIRRDHYSNQAISYPGPGRYFPPVNGRINPVMAEAWRKVAVVHQERTKLEGSEEDITPQIEYFLSLPWPRDPTAGFCKGMASARVMLPRPTLEGAAIHGVEFERDHLDALFAALFEKSGAYTEELYGATWPAEGACYRRGERSNPIFWHNLLWYWLEKKRERFVIEASTTPSQFWAYAIYAYSMDVERLANGLSRFGTTMWGMAYRDAPGFSGQDMRFDFTYLVNDQDPRYPGGFIGGTRRYEGGAVIDHPMPNSAWTPDPRRYIVENGVHSRFEGNYITHRVMETIRRLSQHSEAEWAPFVSPPEQQPLHCS